MLLKIPEYTTEDSKSPFGEWFSTLSTKPALKVRTALAQMEADNFGDHKSVGAVFGNVVSTSRRGIACISGRIGDQVVILVRGGTKARQQSDIAKAKEYWSDYKRRKRQARKKGSSDGTSTRFQRNRKRAS